MSVAKASSTSPTKVKRRGSFEKNSTAGSPMKEPTSTQTLV